MPTPYEQLQEACKVLKEQAQLNADERFMLLRNKEVSTYLNELGPKIDQSSERVFHVLAELQPPAGQQDTGKRYDTLYTLIVQAGPKMMKIGELQIEISKLLFMNLMYLGAKHTGHVPHVGWFPNSDGFENEKQAIQFNASVKDGVLDFGVGLYAQEDPLLEGATPEQRQRVKDKRDEFQVRAQAIGTAMMQSFLLGQKDSTGTNLYVLNSNKICNAADGMPANLTGDSPVMKDAAAYFKQSMCTAVADDQVEVEYDENLRSSFGPR